MAQNCDMIILYLSRSMMLRMLFYPFNHH